MRAAVVKRANGPMGVEIMDAPAPEPDGDVVVDVVTAGVAFPDVLLARGSYQVRPDPPFTLGVECAGVVRSAPGHAGLSPGDRVVGFGLGCLAEQVALPTTSTFPMPPGMSFAAAGGFVMNYHTAHVALHRRGGLKRGETVLVHGAGGGLGTAVVQVAKAAGARVLGTASSDEKRDFATRAGADEVMDSTTEWAAAVREATDGRGVDVAADVVGGEVFDESLRLLAPEGRLLTLGFTSGVIPQVKANRLLLANISVVGIAWGSLLDEQPSLGQEIATELDQLFRDGLVDPLVGEEVPLDEVPQALRVLEGRQAEGKIVARIAPDPA